MADEAKTSEATQAALVLESTGHATDGFKVGTTPVPKPGKGDVLVRVRAASVNPVDWKKAAYNFGLPGVPAVVGCDGSGVVEAVGEGVTEFKEGDEVWAFHNLSLPGRGFFQETNILRTVDVYRKPSNLTFQQAATLGITGLTAIQALFDPALLGLNPPSVGAGDDTTFLLVWGGSSTVGQFAIQLATRAGYKVITTASKHNHELLTSLGAVAVFDYHDDDVVASIKAAVGDGNLTHAFDCASAATALSCAKALTAGGKVIGIAGVPSEGLPEGVTAGSFFMGNRGETKCSEWLNAFVNKEFNPLLEAGKIVTPKIREVKGFEGAKEALVLLAEHKVSATKLVAVLGTSE